MVLEYPNFSKIKDRGSKKWSMSMMLPEHVQAIQQLIEDDKKIPRPVLDETDYECLNEDLAIALRSESLVQLRTWRDGVVRETIGVVQSVDPLSRRITLTKDGEQKTILMDELFSIITIYEA